MVSQLINSCYKAQEGYRWAADAADDENLKRLFEIYALQRTRFAQELREYLPMDDLLEDRVGSPAVDGKCTATRQESIRECLERDGRTLALYKEALAQRSLPIRAHFLISSQLALLEKVYDRMHLMLQERPGMRSTAQGYRLST
jgi:hypothetical protein